MSRLVEMWEVSFEMHTVVFTVQDDAVKAASALSRGAYVTSACDPNNPQARITLKPIAPALRRVFIPATERMCVAAFGECLKSVKRNKIGAAKAGLLGVAND